LDSKLIESPTEYFDKVEYFIFCFGITISIGQLMLFFQFPEFPENYYFLGIFVIMVFLTTSTIILHRNKRLKKNPVIV
jgi:hypothetical protein